VQKYAQKPPSKICSVSRALKAVKTKVFVIQGASLEASIRQYFQVILALIIQL